jgi:superfamily II DNA or RNA helicase
MRKLIERIEKNAFAANPAASRMLGNNPVSGESKSILEKNLHEDQLKALQSALGRDLTFIWGPPGTGKTHTIGTITEYLYRDKHTVLIVSHTNTAVDQAIKHVAMQH